MSQLEQKRAFFTENLMIWFSQNHRPLPWKGEKNPYLVWLSEIILQQTRVEQGLPYFERFKTAYPRVQDLANASEDEVMKMWEGLGYYSRARNLHFTSKFITHELNGVFPSQYAEILKLKGVGVYTAAAIASFAFDLPNAVVDGNVYRVLARFFGIKTPIDTTQGKKEFAALAQQLIDTNQPANYNQAIMDFGATHCTPNHPKCKNCSMQKHCTAYQEKNVHLLPIKSKKLKKRNRFFNFLIFHVGEQTFIRKRIEKDIWQNLYEFPLIETDKLIATKKALMTQPLWEQLIEGQEVIFNKKSKPFKQLLTHQKIMACFWEITLAQTTINLQDHFLKIDRKDLSNFAFPKIIDNYLSDKKLDLFDQIIN